MKFLDPSLPLDGAQARLTVSFENGNPRAIHDSLKLLPPYACSVVSDEKYLTVRMWIDQPQKTIKNAAKESELIRSEKHEWEAKHAAKQVELNNLEASLKEAQKKLDDAESVKRDLVTEKRKLAKKVEDRQRELSKLEEKERVLVTRITELEHKSAEMDDRVRSWVSAYFITEEEAAIPPSTKLDERFAPHSVADATAYVDEVHRYLVHEKHLHYPRTLVENIFALIATHDTLVFAGTPGSGKTAFVRAFSEATSSLEGTIIAVKPNWTSGEDLFGYWNPTAGHFVASEFAAAIIKAENNPDKLSLICLDEMNLARVEYYFADLLSALEKRPAPEEITLIPDSVVRSITDEKQQVRCRRYGRIVIPRNVRIIGCLNMDETTMALSPKVLDRVHVVQFPDPLKLPPDFTEKTPASKARSRPLDAKSFERREYPPMSKDDSVCQQLTHWRDELTNIGMTLSPRAIRQAMNYRDCLASIVGEPLATWQVLNNTCLQKFVPRLERDMPDQDTADERHASVKRLAHSFEELTRKFPELYVNGKLESVAASTLNELHEAAQKRSDKRYSVWK
jgi:energy-coupling factor transporter ATP-binding protein EcfA2